MALAECSIQGNMGFNGDFLVDVRWDATLFGERQSRIVISLPVNKWETLESLAKDYDIPATKLGYTGGDRFNINGYCDVPVSQIRDVWNQGLEAAGGG